MLPEIDALNAKNKITAKPTAIPISLKILKPFLNINLSPTIIIVKQRIACQEKHQNLISAHKLFLQFHQSRRQF